MKLSTQKSISTPTIPRSTIISRRQTWAIVVKPSLTQSNSSVFGPKTVILHLTTTIQRWWSSFPHKCTEYTISTSIPLTNSSMVINLGASSYANCVHVNEHLKWDEHIKNTLAASYATHSVLKKAQTRDNISTKKNPATWKSDLVKTQLWRACLLFTATISITTSTKSPILRQRVL